MSIPIGSGNPVTVAAVSNGTVGDVAADASGIYWASSATNLIMSAPLEGGTVVTRAAGQGTPAYVLTDSTAIYWLNVGSGMVMKLAK